MQTKVDAYNPAGALAIYINVKNMVKDDANEIAKYYDLKEKGAITEEEFKKKKNEILE